MSAYDGNGGQHTSFVFQGAVTGLSKCPADHDANVLGYWANEGCITCD